jgi:crossover junction endodeoxyribonuclease RuvC
LEFSATLENQLAPAVFVDFRLEAGRADPKLHHAATRRRKFSLTMRVLAIDASLRNTGVAVIEANGNGKFQALYFGVIHNAAALPMSSCLVAIRDRLAELIHQHEPDACALESVIYVQSHRTAITLGAARGAAILAAAERGLAVFEYAPKRIKQATVGHGSADKSQVAFMVRALLNLTETPGSDAADALAIGLTHLRAQEGARVGLPAQLRI